MIAANDTEEINAYNSFEIYKQLGIPISNVTVIDGYIQLMY